MKFRFATIQALRGIAALAVMGFHLRYFSLLHLQHEFMPWLRHGQAGVDLFFVLSGYILVQVALPPGRPAVRPVAFIWRRILRIYPLYWVCTLAIAAAYFYGPKIGAGRMESPEKNLITSLTLWPVASLPVLRQAWSLIAEVYFSLVFAGLLALGARRIAAGLALWALVVAVGGFWLGPFSDLPLSAVQTWVDPLTLEFVAGAGVALAQQAGRQGFALPSLAIAALIFSIAIFLPERPMHGFGRIFWYGLPALLVLHSFTVLEQRKGFRFPRWVERAGDFSYSLYLTHQFVIIAGGSLLLRILPAGLGIAGRAILLLGLAAGAIAFAYLTWKWVESPLLRMSARLTHSRPVNADPSPSRLEPALEIAGEPRR